MQKLRRHFVCYDPARAQAAQKVGAAWLLRAHFPNVKIGHVLDAGLCEWHPLCAEWRNPEYAEIAWHAPRQIQIHPRVANAIVHAAKRRRSEPRNLRDR